MIKEFISKWWQNKDNIEHYFRSIQKIESLEYIDIVKALIENVLNVDAGEKQKISTDIHEIDDGYWCQGMQMFIVRNDTKDPTLSDYFFADNYYGSCSGCDTLMGITKYSEKPATEEQIKKLMTLAFDLLRSFKPFVSNATYRGLPIHLTEGGNEMLNLNECKFGDRLQTKDGRLAIFMKKLKYSERYSIAVSESGSFYTDCYEKVGDRYESQYDIYKGTRDIIRKINLYGES